jgi:hypothetical protein
MQLQLCIRLKKEVTKNTPQLFHATKETKINILAMVICSMDEKVADATKMHTRKKNIFSLQQLTMLAMCLIFSSWSWLETI